MTSEAALVEEDQIDVVWSPLKGSQTLFMSCPAKLILYHGTRGPGKTDAQLMRFASRVGKGFGRFWRGVIFDQEYKDLDDLVSKSQRWFPECAQGARFLRSTSDYRWVWPDGEELLFRSIKRDEDYWSYHGQEFPYIGWNELGKYPLPTLFDAMMSCNRSSFIPDKPGMSEIPLEVVATCNPYGAGHNWIKKRFINKSKPGEIRTTVIDVFNPRTQKREPVKRTQCHIYGSYKENKYLSPEYIAELESIIDPNKKKAWLKGSWDIQAGGLFDHIWDANQHVIKPFRIPESWTITRAFDYGYSAPFSVGWWAISDGSDVLLANGKYMSTVRGDLFRIAEWYGCIKGANGESKPEEGIRMLAVDISKGIIERQMAMGIQNRVTPGPADNSINDVIDGGSIAAEMRLPVKINGAIYHGVHWTKSNKSPGSRVVGWERMTKYLRNALITPERPVREYPGMFIFDTCPDFIDLVPIMTRDPKNLDDTDSITDHIGDESRYMVLSTGKINLGDKVRGMT